MSEKSKSIVICMFGLIILVVILVFATPIMKGVSNRYSATIQEIDDNTNYKTLKKVEDTCRSMISSYESDKLTYEQYKDSENEEKQSWAEQAKMRANKTAATYNNYILENGYVWSNNVPKDIDDKLEYLE